MSNRSPVLLLKGATREAAEAEIVEGLSAQELADVDQAWQSFLAPILEVRSGIVRANYNSWYDFVESAYDRIVAQGGTLDDLPEHPHWEWCGKQAQTNSIGY